MSLLTGRIQALQDRLLRLAGSAPEGRAALMRRMVSREASQLVGYWLAFVVSVGIATLGLVTGSSAVIIGAMLIAPLMEPIIALALGLAIGSPLLSLRALIRISLSVLVAVLGAALITVLLPFHEVNPEIAARVSPTLLDLVTAMFCAVAGLYAYIRDTSDAVTAGAGTAIGISLVPPLCVAGYGVGTGSWSLASGASLLFLTNIVAIVVVGGAIFLILGFDRVEPSAMEKEELRKQASPLVRALTSRLSEVFGRPDGKVYRLVMPLVILAAVAFPLKSALDEVAWQVSVRRSVRALIEQDARPVIQTATRIERGRVDVSVVLLGTHVDAERTRLRLDAEIRQVSGLAPRLSVSAVGDARGLDTITAVPLPSPPPVQTLSQAQEILNAALQDFWPNDAAGRLLAIDFGERQGGIHVRLVHFGRPAGPAVEEAAQRVLTTTLGRPVTVEDVSIPDAPITKFESDEDALIALQAGLSAARSIPGISICYSSPAQGSRGARRTARVIAIEKQLALMPNVERTVSRSFEIRFAALPCAPPAAAGPTPRTETEPLGSQPKGQP